MWEAVLVGITVLVWLTALDKVRMAGRWPEDSVQRANLLALIAFALILSLTIPSVYEAVDRLSGVTNLALLLANSLTVAGLWAFQPLVRHARQLAQDYALSHGVTGLLVEPTRVRRIFGSGWVMFTVLISLCILFSLAPIHGVEISDYDEFMSLYATAPFMAAYIVIFAVYAGGMVSELFLLAALNSRKLTTLALRLRGYLQATGWAACIAWLIHSVLYMLVRQHGLEYPVAEARLVRNALVASGVVLLMSGGFIDLCTWARCWLDHRRLYPLWRALWHEFPGVMQDTSFPPAQSGFLDAFAVSDLDSRRYRRIIKIRDGIVALRPHADGAVIARARLLCRSSAVDSDTTDAIVEAAAIQSAIYEKTHQKRGGRLAVPGPTQEATIVNSSSVDQLALQEMAHLIRVARAFGHSRIVAAALAEALDASKAAEAPKVHQT